MILTTLRISLIAKRKKTDGKLSLPVVKPVTPPPSASEEHPLKYRYTHSHSVFNDDTDTVQATLKATSQYRYTQQVLQSVIDSDPAYKDIQVERPMRSVFDLSLQLPIADTTSKEERETALYKGEELLAGFIDKARAAIARSQQQAL